MPFPATGEALRSPAAHERRACAPVSVGVLPRARAAGRSCERTRVRVAHLPLLLLLWGCSGSSAPPEPTSDPASIATRADATAGFAGEPSIRGTITAVDGGSIRVEEVPGEESGGAKAIVRVGRETAIRRAGGPAATAADLDVGGRVSVWFRGPVAESYPVQAAAGAIEIEQGTAP